MIGWPYYHDNITNTFDKFFFTNFNMKQFKKEKYFQIDFKNDNKEKDLLNSEIGNEYLQFFCDITYCCIPPTFKHYKLFVISSYDYRKKIYIYLIN